MNRLLRPLVYVALIVALWAVGRGFGKAFSATASGSVSEGASFLLWLLGYAVLGLGLGLLVAWDLSTLLGTASEQFILGTRGRAMRFDPRLKRAERLLGEHKPMEAINLLREYLTDKPRHWHAAVRIAEIYQGPMNNALAAALEYESLLQEGRLPRAARPWIMLRLADTFLFLGRGDEATTRFEEIIQRYPRSGAAEKAQRRLAAADPEAEESQATADETPANPTQADAAEAPPAKPALPPGFTPFGERAPRRK